MNKIDFKKEYKKYYNPKTDKAEIVIVPKMHFLMIDGQGAPESDAFQKAVEAMYGVAYTIKFSRKKAHIAPDYSMGPLEGLWAIDNSEGFDPKKAEEYMAKRQEWTWTLMLWQPDVITVKDLEQAKAAIKVKKPGVPVDNLKLEHFEEGEVVQIMHIGPYSDEAKSVTKMDEFAAENKLKMHGKHHEIYLGDPRRSAPDKLKTILRHPVS